MHFSLVPSSPAMHIPDGFLSLLVSVVFWALSIAVLAVALRQARKTIGERDVPLMGVLAAAIFAGQMLNFTIPGGTSGHLLGATLAAALLGPWPAVLVLTAVVAVQALLFQDGGILTLGANIFNMAIVGVFVAYPIYTFARRLLANWKPGVIVAGFAAAWASIMAASLSCALQLALSGSSPANIAIPAMAGVHAVIGIGEGLITAGALTFLMAARKDLLSPDTNSSKTGSTGILVGGSLLAILLAVLSPLASAYPDGLEAVAEQRGFMELARKAAYNIFPDYTIPGLANPTETSIVAGLAGALIVFGVAFGIARLEKQRSPLRKVDQTDE